MFFFFKQKTAYEMRISDWSSDVCSSDLIADALGYPQSSTSALLRSLVGMGYLNYDAHARTYITSSRVALLGSWVNSQFFAEGAIISLMKEIGRASCRERVCQYV